MKFPDRVMLSWFVVEIEALSSGRGLMPLWALAIVGALLGCIWQLGVWAYDQLSEEDQPS